MSDPTPPRTPSDVPLTQWEDALAQMGAGPTRWWMFYQDGRLIDLADQEHLRPADANLPEVLEDGTPDWYTPWYQKGVSHVHGADRAEMAWSCHIRGTREGARAAHIAVLRRLGRVTHEEAQLLLVQLVQSVLPLPAAAGTGAYLALQKRRRDRRKEA